MQLGEMVEPAYASCPDYDYTHGPAVVDLCKLAKFVPDPEQELALEWIFAVGYDGKPVAFEFAIVACRQNIKTGLFKMAALGWLFKTNQMLIVWSAHEFNTAQEAHRDMCDLIKGCPELDAQVKAYYYGNGDESIELHTGARLVFKARTKGGGRGLSGDKVVLDEAFALQPTHLGSLVPLLRTRAEPQLIYGSSAPKADSLVLHELQDRGRSGKSPRLAYLEWSAPEGGCEEPQCDHHRDRQGCALDDRENWQKANTALGRRITMATIQAERELLPPAEFARELLGWPDKPNGAESEPIFGAMKWEDCAVPAGESEPVTRRCFGVAVTLDRKHTAIGVAGERDDGLMHLEPIVHRSGVGWAPKELKRLQDEHGYPVMIDVKGPASVLVNDLDKLGVEVVEMDTSDVCDAFGMLFDHVNDKTVRHMSYPELDGAVAGATPRFIGDRLALGRKTSTFDISPLEACQNAAWGSWSGHGTDYDLMNSFL